MATEKPLPEAQQQILRSQVFDALHPGALLHDFHLVLDYIGTKGVKSGGKHNILPLAAIPKLDEQLAHPLRVPLQRPQLRSHPYLQGLHLLGRASALVIVEGAGEKARLVVDAVALQSWTGLNPTEQYFALLEAWLLYARAEVLGETWPSDENFLNRCLSVGYQLRSTSSKSTSGLDTFHDRMLLDRELYQVALFDLFGLIEVEHPQQPVTPWQPDRVTLTPFGKALLTVFGEPPYRRRFEEKLSDEGEDEKEDLKPEEQEGSWLVFGRFQPLFGPYFPQWQNNLVLPRIEEREGVFVFRVSLVDLWRLIAISSEDTLDDLAAAILNSVKFDFDHLYDFTYRDRFGSTNRIAHPVVGAELSTDEVSIGELPLPIGQSMTFRYDFGDDWQFEVKLERIDPPNPKMKKPRVLEKHGKSPEQYPGADW